MDFKWLQNTFQAFTKQFFSYRGSLRRHDLCICNLIVLIANQIPLQKLGNLIGMQLVVSNIRLFSRVHSLASILAERDVKSLYYQATKHSVRDTFNVTLAWTVNVVYQILCMNFGRLREISYLWK